MSEFTGIQIAVSTGICETQTPMQGGATTLRGIPEIKREVRYLRGGRLPQAVITGDRGVLLYTIHPAIHLDPNPMPDWRTWFWNRITSKDTPVLGMLSGYP